MSEESFDQQVALIRSEADLEDFMLYYDFDESEKPPIRQEWMSVNSKPRERGFVIDFVEFLLLRKAWRHHKRKKAERQGWQPGMGAASKGLSGPIGPGVAYNAASISQGPPQPAFTGLQSFGSPYSPSQQPLPLQYAEPGYGFAPPYSSPVTPLYGQPQAIPFASPYGSPAVAYSAPAAAGGFAGSPQLPPFQPANVYGFGSPVTPLPFGTSAPMAPVYGVPQPASPHWFHRY